MQSARQKAKDSLKQAGAEMFQLGHEMMQEGLEEEAEEMWEDIQKINKIMDRLDRNKANPTGTPYKEMENSPSWK